MPAYARLASVAPPENAKTFFSEIRNPQKGTSDARLASVAPPENAKTFFPEIRNPQKGTSDARRKLCCTPQKRENLFPGNKKPPKRDIRRPPRTHGANLFFPNFKNTKPFMVTKKSAKKVPQFT